MNDFEKYILENKRQLEPKKVDPKVWLAVENEILKGKNKRFQYLIKALILGIILSFVAYFFYSNIHQNQPLDEERILAQYDLTQYNFTQQVNIKKQQLAKASVPQDKIEDFQILLQQLEFMDGQFQDYLQYIEENGYQEFIGDQILNFYKSKIELLDKIQKEVEKINYYENLQPSNSDKVEIQI